MIQNCRNERRKTRNDTFSDRALEWRSYRKVRISTGGRNGSKRHDGFDSVVCWIACSARGQRQPDPRRRNHNSRQHTDRRAEHRRRLLAARGDPRRQSRPGGGCVRGRQRRGHDRAAERSHLHPDPCGRRRHGHPGRPGHHRRPHPHRQQRDYRRQRCNHAGPGHPGVSRKHRHDLERHASQRANHLVWRRHPQRGQPDAAHGYSQRQSKHHQRRRRHRKRT